MTSIRQEKPAKKRRARLSSEMIAELILEAERSGNAADICRRKNIAPNLFYRRRQKAREGMVPGLKQMKRGPKAKDAEKTVLAAGNERLKAALCDQTIELQVLKKSVSSDYMDR